MRILSEIALSLCFVAIALPLIACGQKFQATPAFIRHPDQPSRKVEYYLQTPNGKGPWPTIVFIHGHQVGFKNGGRDFVDWGVLGQFANRGFAAVAISQPGYGASDGPADYCGPYTQKAVIAVLVKLEQDGISRPGRTILQGISRGAIVAGLVAAREKSIRGIILISGVFDLTKYRVDAETSAEKKAILESMIDEIGASEEALRARSLIHFARNIRAETLILNGQNDEKTDPEQARTMAAEIRKHGGRAKVVIFPDRGHQIPVAERARIVDPFIDSLAIPR